MRVMTHIFLLYYIIYKNYVEIYNIHKKNTSLTTCILGAVGIVICEIWPHKILRISLSICCVYYIIVQYLFQVFYANALNLIC